MSRRNASAGRSREELLRARRALVERAPPGGVELPAECGSGLLSSEAPFSRLMLRHANLGTTAHKYEARRIDARAGFFDDDATLPLELPSSPAAAAVEWADGHPEPVPRRRRCSHTLERKGESGPRPTGVLPLSTRLG